MKVRAAQDGNPTIVSPTGLEFQITYKKSYLPVVIYQKKMI